MALCRWVLAAAGVASPTIFTAFVIAQGLLHPDYTDEEIRREVMNWGVSDEPGGKALRLEEKGTVYQEMVSTYTHPDQVLWRTLTRAIVRRTPK